VRPVKLLTVGAAGASGRREYPATLSPQVDAMLGFEVPGRIVEFPVREGDRVETGQVLARIDARDYDARLGAARAEVRKAEADLRRGLSVRHEDAGAISMAMIDLLRRSVEVARAQQTEAQKAVEDATLRAPIAGRVARKLVDVYANVQAKEPVVNLQDDAVIEAVVNLPERDLATMTPPETRERATALLAPEVVISARPGQSYAAQVKEFAPTADPVTRTFKLTLTLGRPEDMLMLPGMTGKALLSFGALAATGGLGLRVPAHAVVTGPERTPFLWVVAPETMVVERRAVRLGGIVGDQIEVLDGLHAGEIISIAGVHDLRDGMTVRRLES
jgi:RND family efflux transporter MFP subunit